MDLLWFVRTDIHSKGPQQFYQGNIKLLVLMTAIHIKENIILRFSWHAIDQYKKNNEMFSHQMESDT